jgi:hypothetical protein
MKEGPTLRVVTVRNEVCNGCIHLQTTMRSRSIRARPGGTTDNWYCKHPSVERHIEAVNRTMPRYIGFGSGLTATPEWCPIKKREK